MLTIERQKLLAATHFVVHECEPKKLGATRLNKILWFADAIAFKLWRKSITDGTYIKREKGPVPSHILWALECLELSGKISIQEPTYPYDVRKFFSRIQPEDKNLAEDEKRVLITVIEAVIERTANEISEISHTNIWRAAQEGEEIPIYATLADNPGPITPEVYAWATENA